MQAVIVILALVAFAALVITVNRSRARRFDIRWQLAADLLDLDFDAVGSELGRIHGTLDGFAVEVDVELRKTRRGHDPYTRYRVFYPDLGLGLWLRRQKGWTKAVASALGQDLAVGEAEFDKAFLVDGTDEDVVRGFLTPERRAALLFLATDYPDLVVRDDTLSWATKGRGDEGETIAAHLQRIVAGTRQLLR